MEQIIFTLPSYLTSLLLTPVHSNWCRRMYLMTVDMGIRYMAFNAVEAVGVRVCVAVVCVKIVQLIYVIDLPESFLVLYRTLQYAFIIMMLDRLSMVSVLDTVDNVSSVTRSVFLASKPSKENRAGDNLLS